MSRVAYAPIKVPNGVEVAVEAAAVRVKGPKGALAYTLPKSVSVAQEDGVLRCQPREGIPGALALAGTARSIINGMVIGVSEGFEKRLALVGVGYRAQMQGNSLNLTLGYSHPINFPVPDGVQIETPSQTEIVIRGFDKQKVGQVAAEIRGMRPPEPYKGKGVKYADESIIRKEAKKK